MQATLIKLIRLTTPRKIFGINRTRISKSKSSISSRMAPCWSPVTPVHVEGLQTETSHPEVIREGLAEIIVPHGISQSLHSKHLGSEETLQSVFYNPIQQFNRDLSVLAIKAFGEDLIALRLSKRKLRPRKKRKITIDHDEHSHSAETRDSLSQVKTGDAHEVKRPKKNPDDEIPNLAKQISSSTTGSLLLLESEPLKNNRQQTGLSENLLTRENNHVSQVDQTPELERSQVGISLKTQTEDDEELQNAPTITFRILDALSATGLRALRYAKEIPFATFVTANDLSAEATKSIVLNVEHNKLQSKVKVVTGNAIALMYQSTGQKNDVPFTKEHKYDVVDLDPYGTAVPFLDAALHALNDGGLLCVTCTDSGVFNSVGYPEKAYALYGGTPIKGLHSHEGGLRLILHSIASTAARYGLTIEPLMSLSIDYYARVFVRITRSPAHVKMLAGKTMVVYNCDSGCGAWTTQYLARNQASTAKDGSVAYKHGLALAPTAGALCEHCGFKTHMSGPMYGGPIHNPAFLERLLSYLPSLDETTYGTKGRIEGMLSTALEETSLSKIHNVTMYHRSNATTGDHRSMPRLDPSLVDKYPFYFVPSALAKVIHCQAPSEAAVKGALRHSGYQAVRSHTKPGTIRTDAPWTFIWEMMREWIRQKAPIKEEAVRPGTAGWGILHGWDCKMKTKEGQKNGNGFAVSETDGLSSGERSAKQSIKFDEALGKDQNTKKRLIRYQINPRANWGPMNKAKAGKSGTSKP